MPRQIGQTAHIEVSTEPRIVRGFRFAGVSAGLKKEPGRKDLGLIVADSPAAVAAVFTTNQVKAAPVLIAAERAARGALRAVVVNSGSANCFTGRTGLKLARDSCAAVARELGCSANLVVPCSTGVIGHLYDLDKFTAGVRQLASHLSDDGLRSFAQAIMTTDTVPKIASAQIEIGGASVTIAGTSKGAGMIAPHMATMLGFIVTDAKVPATRLKRSLKTAVDSSFNAITIDGDMSTNDTLMLLASGAAANRNLNAREQDLFDRALGEVAASLARQLVRDGEGATRLVRIEVAGARSRADAARVARQIANSPLVKTAFFGRDPNVGRIMAAAGSAGVTLDPARIELFINDVRVASRGMIVVGALEGAAAVMNQREYTVRVNLRTGDHSAFVTTSDLSFDYVKINAEYTT